MSHDILKHIVTQSTLDEFGSDFSKMKKVNLKDVSDHLKLAVKVDIGFGAKCAIPQKDDPRKKLEFYIACKNF